ncbi:MAG: type II toxin-antitoxin system VapC family toxin [Planctomycetaceae bacterium]
MKYVIDASIGFKWAVVEPLADKARQLQEDFRNGIHELLAPDLFPTEVANALLVSERRGRVLPGQGSLLLTDILLELPHIHPAVLSLPRAYEIAHQTRASVYDCLYVALAEREGCELVTADSRLVNTLGPRYPFMIGLASLP